MKEVLSALNKWRRQEFTYGSVDCCQFAGFIVKELTGKDYLSDFNYNSEGSALEIIAKNGDLVATASTVLGPISDNPKDLASGNPVIVLIDDLQIMGVKLQDRAVCLVRKGMIQISSDYIVAGWDICHKS